MRTVESYRGLQVHVFDPGEEIPSWVRGDVRLPTGQPLARDAGLSLTPGASPSVNSIPDPTSARA